ncbi:MAG: AraC family transcriptional regulator [Draconibacterium sp.]
MNRPKISAIPQSGKQDQFYGDRSVVLSKLQIEKSRQNALFGELYLSDIGFYPAAKGHLRKRDSGIQEHILIYCIDGSGFVSLNEESFEIVPNSYFVIEAGKAHSYWSSEEMPWSIYWLHFGGKRSNCFGRFFGKVQQLDPAGDARVDARIRYFDDILTVLEAGFSLENLEYSNLCLNSLLASFFYVNTIRSAKGLKYKDPVEKAIHYMQENLNRMLSIGELARAAQLSESHLSKLFKQRTGVSPIDYFIKLKMQEAIRLLTNQSLRIKEVAFILGYKDPFYFSRIFTKHIGENPKAFLGM